jgi:hypothetical protein
MDVGTPEDLRQTAARLRAHVDALTTILSRLRLYDRPDVWQGRAALAFRQGLVDQHRVVLGPAGAATAMLDLATRLEAQALWLTLESANSRGFPGLAPAQWPPPGWPASP